MYLTSTKGWFLQVTKLESCSLSGNQKHRAIQSSKKQADSVTKQNTDSTHNCRLRSSENCIVRVISSGWKRKGFRNFLIQHVSRIHRSLHLLIPRGFFSVVVVLYSYIVEYAFV